MTKIDTRQSGVSAVKPKSNGFHKQITGDGPLMPVILRLALPVVLMMNLQNAYNIIDTIWVGQLLGRQALAGIGSGGYVLWMVFGLAGLVGTGLMAVISRRFGEDDIEEAERTAGLGLWYALLLSLVIGLLIWFLLPLMFRMMGTDAVVTEEGTNYIRILLIGIPFIFLTFAIQNIFQASGDTITPMWLMALSLFINSALDPVLMLGLLGMPKMGIAGAAYATVIARMGWVILGFYLLAKGKRIGQQESGFIRRALPKIKEGSMRLVPNVRFAWDWPLFGRVFRIGLPHAFSMTLFPLVYMIIVRIPAQYGAVQIAALRVGHTVEGMSFFLALGFSIATSACVGQNLGAGKVDRASRAAWTGTGMVSSVLLLFSFGFYLLAEPITAIFTSDPQTIAAGAVYLRILAFSQAFMGVEIVLGGGFTGAGDTLPPMLVAVPFNLARIPAAYFLAGYMGMGVNGVWWAISGSTVVKGTLLAFLFMLGRWKNKRA